MATHLIPHASYNLLEPSDLTLVDDEWSMFDGFTVQKRKNKPMVLLRVRAYADDQEAGDLIERSPRCGLMIWLREEKAG